MSSTGSDRTAELAALTPERAMAVLFETMREAGLPATSTK